MKKLLKQINKLKNSEIKKIIDLRIKEFKSNSKTNKKIFSELCFCLLTANFNAEKAIKIQKTLEKDFCLACENKLAEKLKQQGHRFPNIRAKYIYLCQNKKRNLKQKLNKFKAGKQTRRWLIKNIKGLGIKESSHFLRNIGYKDIAIIDFHIINLLKREKIIKNKPKTLTEKQYKTIEICLQKIAEKANLNLAELDLYLWYLETGKVLK